MKESSSAILFFSSFKGLQIFGLLNWKDGGGEANQITCLSEWEINDCHNLTSLTMSSSSSISYLDWHPLSVFISLSWGGYTFVMSIKSYCGWQCLPLLHWRCWIFVEEVIQVIQYLCLRKLWSLTRLNNLSIMDCHGLFVSSMKLGFSDNEDDDDTVKQFQGLRSLHAIFGNCINSKVCLSPKRDSTCYHSGNSLMV